MSLTQEAIIKQQREELDALESLVIEYQETISNLEKRVYNYTENEWECPTCGKPC